MDEYTVNKQRLVKGLVIGLAFIVFGVNIYFQMRKNITLQVDDEIIEIKSFANTVERCLDKEGISLDKENYINYPLDANLEDNMYLVVKSPKSYNIKIGDDIHQKKTSAHNSVKRILSDLDIRLSALDYTKPELSETVENGGTIEIFRVKEVFEEINDEIPFEKVIKDNKELDKGKTNIIQKGQIGIKTRKIKEKYINGQLADTEVLKEEITKQPVKQIAERGTKQLIVATRGKTEGNSVSRGNINSNGTVVMNASAYDLSYNSTGKRPGDRGYGITASGTNARPGVVAVDPRVIPLGTKLYVESLDGTKDYGYATAEDTGGAIKGNKIDLFFESAGQVKNFGRRNVKVHILK